MVKQRSLSAAARGTPRPRRAGKAAAAAASRGNGNGGGDGGASGAAVHAPLAAAQLAAVAEMFAALSEPTRLAILQHLRGGPASVGEIVDALGMKQANVSKQLALLQRAGLVARRPDGLRAIYSIAMPVVFELCDLVCGHVAEQARHRADALAR